MTLPALISERVPQRTRGRPLPLCLVYLAGIACFAGVARADPAAPVLLRHFEQEVTALHALAREAVVKIHAEQQMSLGNLRLAPYHRVGTGFFVATNGLLVTAATVVAGADVCWVESGNRRLPARIRGLDRRTNLALLEVDPPDDREARPPWPCLTLSDRPVPAVGTFVVAVGFAYDLPCAPSVGVIQGVDLCRGTNVLITSHLRADCRLKPGQAGAPLMGTDGAVVGIAVAACGDDQCYALPAGAARRVVDDLVAHGRTRYCWVGLEVVQRRPASPTDEGDQPLVLVQGVCPNSPAARAGFRPQDQLVQIEHRPIAGLACVMDTVFHHRAGDALTFTVRRDGALCEINVVLSATPTSPTPAAPTGAPALRLTPVDASR